MKLVITASYDESAALVARMMAETVTRKPSAVLGLATGSTPEPVYRRLLETPGLNLSHITAVNLDEYVGLAPQHPQSYRFYMDARLFRPGGVLAEHIIIPRGDVETEGELRRLNAFTDANPIDLQLLSVGVNGHLGFNEPSDLFYDKYHLVALTEQTRRSNARLFSRLEDVPTQAITMGVGDIMRASGVVFLATGTEKLAAMRAILETGDVTPRCQGTILKLHRHCTIYLDRELAAEISPAPWVEVSHT